MLLRVGDAICVANCVLMLQPVTWSLKYAKLLKTVSEFVGWLNELLQR